ncbi:MAG: hypothetical protein NVS4B6_24590 [Mycobacterium sp.]
MPLDVQRTDTITQLEGLANIPQTAMAIVPAVAAAVAFEIPVYKAPSRGSAVIINRLSIIAAVAITGAATNFQTLQFRQWRAGVLVGLLTGATTYVTTVTLAVQTELALFLPSSTVTAAALLPGDVLTLQNVASGTGAALPTLTVVVESSSVPPAFGY